MKNTITFSFPTLPPSVNHAMLVRGYRRFPSKELTAWTKCVQNTMPITPIPLSPTGYYRLDMVFRFPLLYKNGNVRRRDCTDLVKYAEDVFCSRLLLPDGSTLDDKLIKCGSFAKEDGEESCTIAISLL